MKILRSDHEPVASERVRLSDRRRARCLRGVRPRDGARRGHAPAAAAPTHVLRDAAERERVEHDVLAVKTMGAETAGNPLAVDMGR